MSSSETPTPRYHHFILQLRQELNQTAAESPVWRLSLEDPRTGERKGFRSVDEMAAFLKAWMQTSPDPNTKNQF
ncbi:MAG TPA: hypothetical protein PK530_14685 [Anaerolineales bacterium]|nr:hypothetical protein [Anaerolineales bacterium]